MPVYEDQDELKAATDELGGYSPLVFAGEVRSLQENLAKASQGHGFLLMGGDCAESFGEVRVWVSAGVDMPICALCENDERSGKRKRALGGVRGAIFP
jgi:hypothetical protein